MKKPTFLFLSPLLLLTLLLWAKPRTEEHLTPASTSNTYILPDAPQPARPVAASAAPDKIDKLVKYALNLQGSPYLYAGIKPEGFDCSGFVTHVFGRFGLEVPHSSAMQAEVGKPVQRKEAQPGDLVIFTGTKPTVREPGHVGIVISEPGDTITFVHASSNGGVKVSKVKGSGYDLRFLQLRRVL